jgi:succinate-semialdehyde dehydrogenase/glutarate-semialdehyde dehydrogenase
MPWNFPFWQVLRFAAPALMAGNVALLKHAANVPGSALAIERLFVDAGFPGGAFQTMLVGETEVGALVDDPRVAAVTLTGSTRAGRAIAARAGQALKRCVLELGGSDPYVVLSDADVELAASIGVAARLVNAGQSCIAGKRFIVVPEVRAEFEERFVRRMARAVVGDPRDPGTEIGPLARTDLRDALHRQVRLSVERGARLALGGTVPERQGAWYPPTVLTDVKPGMPAFDEEVFGPVAAIVPARDEQDALRLANATAFGLGAAVFTRDTARGIGLARHALDAGACFVNAQVRSDPRLPFGGIKESGYGRELGAYGIREFVNVKTVWLG